MTIAITDLLQSQTATQVRTTMVNALVTLGIPADKWRPGGSLSVMLTVIATVYSQFTVLMAQAIGSGFLETASGGWLTLLAYYVYGVTRPPATFASGAITLTNTGGVQNYGIGQVVFKDSTSGQTYTNTQAVSLGPNASQTVTIQCTTAGAAGSAPPGEIDTLVTQMLGVTVSNAAAVVGQDALDDPSLRILCQNKLGALSVRGPRSAYAYAISVAVNAVTGAPVNINRQSISRSSHTGTVTIVVASPAGVPDPNDVTGVENSIEQGVPNLSPPFSGARPDCVTVDVSAATGVNYTPTLTVYALAAPGLASSDVATQVAAAITSYLSTYPVGGVPIGNTDALWGSGVESAASQGTTAKIVSIFNATANIEGAPDLVLSSGQVAVDEVTVQAVLVNVA